MTPIEKQLLKNRALQLVCNGETQRAAAGLLAAGIEPESMARIIAFFEATEQRKKEMKLQREKYPPGEGLKMLKQASAHTESIIKILRGL